MLRSEYIKKFLSSGQKSVPVARRIDAEWTDRIEAVAARRGCKFHEVLYTMINGEPSACPTCGGRPNFNRFDRGFYTYCCNSCMGVAKEADKRRTALRKRGVTHSARDPEVRAKAARTCMRTLGVSAPGKSERVKRKIAQTSMRRYGSKAYLSSKEGMARIRRTMLRRYGVDNALKVPEIKSRVIATRAKREQLGMYTDSKIEGRKNYIANCRKNYGVDHPMQHGPTLKKMLNSAYSTKSIELDGKRFDYMGYEHHALRYLRERYSVDCFDTGDRVPTITYVHRGRPRAYQPDIILGKQTIIEVKSPHTAGLQTRHPDARFKLLMRKAEATRDSGYKFRLMVFNGRGELILQTECKNKRHRRYRISMRRRARKFAPHIDLR